MLPEPGALLRLRALTPRDEFFLRRMAYAAWRWDQPWDEAAFRAHAKVSTDDSYTVNFGGLPGDFGIGAEDRGRLVGAAWCRLLIGAARRAGYVDESTPELAVSVESAFRGRGIGLALCEALIEQVGDAGYPALSLHVATRNRLARGIYARLGFRLVEHGESGDVMLLDLRPH